MKLAFSDPIDDKIDVMDTESMTSVGVIEKVPGCTDIWRAYRNDRVCPLCTGEPLEDAKQIFQEYMENEPSKKHEVRIVENNYRLNLSMEELMIIKESLELQATRANAKLQSSSDMFHPKNAKLSTFSREDYEALCEDLIDNGQYVQTLGNLLLRVYNIVNPERRDDDDDSN